MVIARGRGKRVAVVTGILAAGILAGVAWGSWPRILFWLRFEPLGRNARGYSEYRHRRTGIVMVRLPGGTFWMGAQKGDRKGRNYDPEAQGNEGPVHEVTLSPFLMGKYEVTQAQWLKVMGSNPSGFTGDEDHPVERVSWEDIQRFEARAGLTLPTEAQWEYACRAGTSTPFAGKFDDMAWFQGNSGDSTHPVGTKEPNGFGLHDLHGNLREWCEDIYDKEFYGRLEAAGPDPLSTTGSELRVVRGGAYYIKARQCRSGDRVHRMPTDRNVSVGFRLAGPSP